MSELLWYPRVRRGASKEHRVGVSACRRVGVSACRRFDRVTRPRAWQGMRASGVAGLQASAS